MNALGWWQLWNAQKVLLRLGRGVVRLESADWSRNWADTTIAQGFANTMFDKLQDLWDAGYNCSRQGVPQTPHIQELIRLAQDIQDEFANRITKREAWDLHGGSRPEGEQTDRKSKLAAYLGTQYYVNLRKPRTENELRIEPPLW